MISSTTYIVPEIQCILMILFPFIIFSYNFLYANNAEHVSQTMLLFQLCFVGIYSYIVNRKILNCVVNKYCINLNYTEKFIILFLTTTFVGITLMTTTIFYGILFALIIIFAGLALFIKNMFHYNHSYNNHNYSDKDILIINDDDDNDHNELIIDDELNNKNDKNDKDNKDDECNKLYISDKDDEYISSSFVSNIATIYVTEFGDKIHTNPTCCNNMKSIALSINIYDALNKKYFCKGKHCGKLVNTILYRFNEGKFHTLPDCIHLNDAHGLEQYSVNTEEKLVLGQINAMCNICTSNLKKVEI